MSLKKRILISLIVIIVIVLGYFAYVILTTRSHSPADTITYEDSDFTLSIEYCRPYKKDRLIFGTESDGALVPYDTYWRTGANEATEIEFNKKITVEGESIEPGRYRFYTIPNENMWTVAFNSELGKWGYYEPDYSKDVMRVEVMPQPGEAFHEQFTIRTKQLSSSSLLMVLAWDQTSVPIRIDY